MLRVRFALCSLLRCKQRKLRYSGGEIAAVYRVNMTQLLRGNAGVLIAGRKIRAYGKVDYIKAFFHSRTKCLNIVCYGNCRRLWKFLCFVVIIKNILGAYLIHIFICPSADCNIKRYYRKVIFFDKFRRKICRAVNKYFYRSHY